MALLVNSPVHSSTVSTPRLPQGSLAGIALRQHLDAIAVDDQRIAVDLDLAAERTVHGVVARQMRIDLGVAEIVDRDDLQLRALAALVQRAQHVAADAAVTIDPHFQRH